MSKRVAGKVAFITGAARGQGRSHALALAAAGADIVALDFCTDIDTINYPMASKDDLQETIAGVEELGQRAIPIVADVRDYSAVKGAVAEAMANFGRIDIVSPGAGVCSLGSTQTIRNWVDVLDVNMTGVVNTVNASLPHLTSGASIILTGSVAALMPGGPDSSPGGLAYTHAKRSLIDLVRSLGVLLAPESIRINGIHPTNVNTDMLQNDDMYRVFRPDLDAPTRSDAEVAFPAQQAMPVPWVEPQDISSLLVFLASDESRYITGQFIGVDAGAMLKL